MTASLRDSRSSESPRSPGEAAAREGVLLMDVPRTQRHHPLLRYWKVATGLGLATLGVGLVNVSRDDAPAVDRRSVWLDTVRAGALVRDARGSGTLASESMQYVAARTPGRVEQVLARPGTIVRRDMPLVVLSNPDIQLEALSARQQVAVAEASLVALRLSLETQRLTQRGTIAQLGTEARQASRDADVARALQEKKLMSMMEVARSVDHEKELGIRLQTEEERAHALASSTTDQISLQERQLKNLRAVAAFHEERVRSLAVLAGADGVVQALDLQPGQWVTQGTQLARVAAPGHLKAILRIPATDGRDLTLGQVAHVDTHAGIIDGRVIRVDPSVREGTVEVDVALPEQLLAGTRADAPVDGVVELEKIAHAVYVSRIANVDVAGKAYAYRMRDRDHAERVPIVTGRFSAGFVEILQGLVPGDLVVTTDLSRFAGASVIRLR